MDNKELDDILPEEALDDAGPADADAEKKDSASKSKSGSALAVLAILFSLGALAASGYLYMQQKNRSQHTASSFNNLESSLQGIRTELENNQQLAQQNQERQYSGIKSEIQSIKKSTAQRNSETENIQQTWSLEEVHHLLQLAVDQLSLAANIDGALAALEIADRRIAASVDPELQPVRQQIAADIASLRQVERIDLAGTIHRLSAAEKSIDHIPTVGQRTASEQTTTIASLPAEADSVWQKIGQDLSGLVKIRRIDQPEVPLLPPEQAYFLRENTKALLMTARIALLRNDNESYKNTLQQTQQWLNKYFNIESQNAKWALDELEKLAALNPTPQLPDITGSLSQLQAITEGKQR